MRRRTQWVADRGLDRDTAAERVAHDIRLSELQVIDETGDVIAHRLERERAIDIRGAAMSLEVHGDRLPVRGECVDVRAEHLDGAGAPWIVDQRRAGAADLGVQLRGR